MISRVIPISLLIRQESTLGQVLNSMARYIRLHNEALLIRVEIANGIVVIREELIVEQLGSIRQLIELAVGALFRMLRELMGNSWGATAHLLHSRPARKPC